MPQISVDGRQLAETINAMNNRLLAVEGKALAFQYLLGRIADAEGDLFQRAAGEIAEVIEQNLTASDLTSPTRATFESALAVLRSINQPDNDRQFQFSVIQGGRDSD